MIPAEAASQAVGESIPVLNLETSLSGSMGTWMIDGGVHRL